MCVALCTTVVHNTAQNSSANFHSYPPDNHHSSDDVYWRGGGTQAIQHTDKDCYSPAVEGGGSQPLVDRGWRPACSWSFWLGRRTAACRVFPPCLSRLGWYKLSSSCGCYHLASLHTQYPHIHTQHTWQTKNICQDQKHTNFSISSDAQCHPVCR